MPCLLVLIGLLFPRILILILYFFTDWFDGVFDSVVWPILGFLFMPFTTLWYSFVMNHYAGQWSGLTIIVMVIAVLIDLGSLGGGYKQKYNRS